MKDFKITPMNIKTDKPQICKWHDIYDESDKLATIHKYVLENGLIKDLGELIETNYEYYKIGFQEEKKSFTIKSNHNDIIGFIICSIYDKKTPKPILFLQYVVINPSYQHKGYGSQIFQELFLNSRKYFGVKPAEIFSWIDKENFSSLNLYHKFGFYFANSQKNYPNFIQASGDMYNILETIQSKQKQNGE